MDSLTLGNLPKGIQILSATDLDKSFVPNNEWFDFEVLAASRPWFALGILNKNPHCRQITFLAPSVQLFQPFTKITEENGIAFLTPHMLKPLPASSILDDKRILNIGMYHAGSWSMKRSEQTLTTLEWWAVRTRDRAQFDLCEGMNMDQLWLNYVPVWIPETVKIAQPGWHFGLHSILAKKLSVSNGNILADEQPLYSVDFAGLTYFDPIWSDHIGLVPESPVFRDLLEKYRTTIRSFQQYVPAGQQPACGKLPDIKSNRLIRNRIAKKLRGLTQYIDQF